VDGNPVSEKSHARYPKAIWYLIDDQWDFDDLTGEKWITGKGICDFCASKR
jgi:hypothetical protein